MIKKKKKRILVRKRVCYFCQNKLTPNYKEWELLHKFLSDRAGILSGDKSGVCSKHQRSVAVAIKRARHLSLLPFVGGI